MSGLGYNLLCFQKSSGNSVSGVKTELPELNYVSQLPARNSDRVYWVQVIRARVRSSGSENCAHPM